MDIATLVRQCLGSFADAANVESNDLYTTDQIHDESGRFRIWAGNVSAHTTGRRSLQHRLRDSPELSSAVIKYLQDLLVAIEKMKLSSSRNHENLNPHLQGSQTVHTSIDVDHGKDYDEEDDDLFGDVVFPPSDDGAIEETRDIISCLFRLSMAFRNPARNDEIRHASTAVTSFYEPHDIQHVNSKFPSISAPLNEKLGIAISRRRQYFKYREEHHQKLASDLDHTGEGTSTVATSLPSVQQRLPLDTYNTDTESLYTATSYALTETGDSLLRFPERPKMATDDMPFECPLCYHIVMASDERSWREHVHEDLLPYVCLHEDCTGAARQYAHRREWRRHMESHEKHWLCPYNCPDTFPSGEDFERHLQVEHLVEVPMLATLRKSCSRKSNMAKPQACTLCERPITASGLWFKHVGHHLEQLALFALPSHLLSTDLDNDSDGGSSMEDMAAHDADAEDASDPMPDHDHMDLDSDDGDEYIPENVVMESFEEIPRVFFDSKFVAQSYPTSSPQHHDTNTTETLSSIVPNRGQPTPPVPDAEEQHRCPYCSTAITRLRDFKVHLLTHSQGKPYVCQKCNARYQLRSDLKRHIMQLHPLGRPHTCSTCGRKFARKDHLARHTNQVCAGRRSDAAEDEFFGDPIEPTDHLIDMNSSEKKSMAGTEYPEEDLDMYKAMEDPDSEDDPMSAGRKTKFPRIDDI